MKKMINIGLVMLIGLCLSACGNAGNKNNENLSVDVNNSGTKDSLSLSEAYPNAHVLKLDADSVTLDGEPLKTYEYIWNYDPSMSEQVYEGDEPDTSTNYIAHDIIYYPEIAEENFEIVDYDGEREWATHYTASGLEDYYFATLPVLGNELPSEMMHTKKEAYDNPVLHIVEPGEYILEGEWHGQIMIDLGDKSDENNKVTLILNGVDVECDVAPALVFYKVYECDSDYEERGENIDGIDMSAAGAKVVLVDGSENNFTGANVYRLLKPEYKKEGSTVQKKYWKMDGAFYSCSSMLIEGNTGILNITSTTYEGLDSELHLSIDGGYINIVSQDDGINVNEDHVSVFMLNDGRLTIFAGQGAEGDVIDSNGYIRINGGILAGTSPSASDNILDSDDGTIVSDKAKVIANVAGITGINNGFGRPGMGKDDGMRPDMNGGIGPGGFDKPMFEGKPMQEPNKQQMNTNNK